MIFLLTLCVLFFSAIIVFNRSKKMETIPKNLQFEKLQNEYLRVYLLATFSDWLQGPYVYKVYSDFGFQERDIATLYIAGFASSSLFGTIIGYAADRYGRRALCIVYGLVYSVCCFTKMFPDFYVLLAGRVLGGISTSILFSTFEAWYVDEHLGRLSLPPEWINDTFSKAGCYTGLLAIVAGMAAQLCAETLALGPVSPFMLAVPFLLTGSYLAAATWRKDSGPRTSAHRSLTAPLYLILFKDRMLLTLGLIQSLFESVLYTFVFSWTPVLSELDPPLGLVFACFMLAFVIGSWLYGMLLSSRLRPPLVLLFTNFLAFLSFSTVSALIAYVTYASPSPLTRALLTRLCFVLFVVYELSVGLYVPAVGYLKSLAVKEEHRASVANWFRLPMNLFTCLSLSLNQTPDSDTQTGRVSLNQFHAVYLLCSGFLFITTLASYVFYKKYARSYSRDESLDESEEIHKIEIELKNEVLSFS